MGFQFPQQRATLILDTPPRPESQMINTGFLSENITNKLKIAAGGRKGDVGTVFPKKEFQRVSNFFFRILWQFASSYI